MRAIVTIALSLISAISVAQNLDKRIAESLGYISQGYVQYGFEELKKVAATNEIAAQFYVAVCLEHGIGVEENLTEAFRMYRKAAERGLPDAMFHIASFYRNGIVVNKDASRENEWLQRFNQKGGKILLPDIVSIYNEGLRNPANYAINPNSEKKSTTLVHNKDNHYSNQQVINNITVVQQTPIDVNNQPQPTVQPKEDKTRADVDIDIPIGTKKQNNCFVVVIANENYQEVEKVQNAINDGEIFAEYCQKTLGIPQDNIKFVPDVTLNGFRRQLNWLSQVMDAYQGEAKVIFYYAGHGIPDESNGSAYLLPVDGFGSDVSTGYNLDKLLLELGSRPAKSVVVLLDACFSGSKRDRGMLASARGVAIKAKQNSPKGNMVIISAAQGDETAYPYKEKGHGMFTYYLLKKLQETKGDVTYGELADYVISEVKKQSIVINGKMQTPTVTASQSASDWRSWIIK